MLDRRRTRGENASQRPATLEPTIRFLRGHWIYRRPEPCPACRVETDLFQTGVSGRDQDGVWTWLRPHPRCAVASLVARGPTHRTRLDTRSSRSFDLGRVRVATELQDLGQGLGGLVRRHHAGDFGTLGNLDGPQDPTLDPWCPGVFDVQDRNRLTIQSGQGLIGSWFRVAGLDVAIL